MCPTVPTLANFSGWVRVHPPPLATVPADRQLWVGVVGMPCIGQHPEDDRAVLEGLAQISRNVQAFTMGRKKIKAHVHLIYTVYPARASLPSRWI